MQKDYKAIFQGYTPINYDPYYSFNVGDKTVLVQCQTYPEFIGKLSPYDHVVLLAEREEACEKGIELKDITWRL